MGLVAREHHEGIKASMELPQRKNIGKRLVGILAVSAMLMLSQHALGAKAPDLGVTWTFDCGPDAPWNDRYTFTPKRVEDEVLLMEWTAGGQRGSWSTPVSMRLTGFRTKKVLGDKITRQVIESGSLSFEKLEVGEEVKAWVRQFDSKWGRNRWRWSVRIKDRITVQTEGFGTLEALVIEKKRYSQEWRYGSQETLYFSPELNFAVYWKYSDTKDNVEECHLVSRDPEWRPPSATRKASGRPEDEPAQAARLTPPDKPPVRSRAEVEAYLERNAWDIRHKLEAYNQEHRVLVGNNNSLTVRKVGSTQVVDLQGDSVFLKIDFQVGRQPANWLAGTGTFVFELKWIEGELEFVAHGGSPEPATGIPATGEPPVNSRDEVKAYLGKNELEFRRKLETYNRTHRVLVGRNNILAIKRIYAAQIVDLQGDRVRLRIEFELGRRGAQWTAGVGTFLFELKWVGDELEFVSHGEG